MSEKSALDKPIVRHSPSTGTDSPDVWGIYEPDTGSVQYICADPATRDAALIDVVWNFDPSNYSTSTDSLEQVVELVNDLGLHVTHILDTHPHADHLMASTQLKEIFGVPNGIGEKVRDIAKIWGDFYNTPNAFSPEKDFDHLFTDGDRFKLGELEVTVMLSPGHTPASVTYCCADAAFVHDTLMYPDSGTSRADFPGGDVGELWNTIQYILSLPENTRLFIGHDYGSEDRGEPCWEATVARHLADNEHVKEGTRREDFIQTRQTRDATLSLPDRMLAALHINLRAGQLPPAENDGRHYLKIPVNRPELTG